MRKLSVLGAVLLLVLPACGGATPPEQQLTEGEVFDGSATTPPPGAIPTTIPGDGTPGAVPGDTGQAPPGSPGATVRPRPGGGAGGAGGATPPASVDPRRAQGPTGSFAATLLREDLTVEVLTQSGAQASRPAFAHLLSQLSEVAGRSVGTSGPIELEGG